MWTTIYVAYNETLATRIMEKLRHEGFLIKINYLVIEREEVYEVLTPALEAEEVQASMIELGII